VGDSVTVTRGGARGSRGELAQLVGRAPALPERETPAITTDQPIATWTARVKTRGSPGLEATNATRVTRRRAVIADEAKAATATGMTIRSCRRLPKCFIVYCFSRRGAMSHSSRSARLES
jgi:hypothetical protein